MERLFAGKDGILGSALVEVNHLDGSSSRPRFREQNEYSIGRRQRHTHGHRFEIPYFEKGDSRSWL